MSAGRSGDGRQFLGVAGERQRRSAIAARGDEAARHDAATQIGGVYAAIRRDRTSADRAVSLMKGYLGYRTCSQPEDRRSWSSLISGLLRSG